tara:strand:- start:1898 stop:2905 length:1008 start_codon:yes stop_codon:yes gene_type:complete
MEYDPDIYDAVELNDLETIQSYWTDSTDVNFQDDLGIDLLILACEYGNIEIVQYLLQYKPDINNRNKKGKSALDIANEKGFTEIVKIIEESNKQMTNLEIINKLRASTFTDEDEGEYQLDFEDGLTDSEIEKLKESFPNGTIDNELIEILKETRGWEGYGPEGVHFDSIGEFGFWELSANSITLGHDGFGNHWILDLNKDGKLGKVFFACHDPAVFVVHSQSLNEYLNHLLKFYQSPAKCHLTNVHDKVVMDIWKENKLCYPKLDFDRNNTEFKDFLAKFEGNDWTIADLRTGKNKDGFAWGKFGPNQYTERHPTELVWAIKNKKKGFLSRLFGK